MDFYIIDEKYKCVCFADIAFRYHEKYKDRQIIKYYDNFIRNYHDPSKHILLATGITSEEIISIYKKYPQYIKGFGELKCYDRWKGGELPYGNLEWIKPILDFNKDLKLPVYIHFNLDSKNHQIEFEKLLSEYKDIPIVLCHCGMVDDDEINNHIFTFVKHLINIYDNLYVDLSYIDTCNYFFKNPNKIFQLKFERIIAGTDINPIIEEVIIDPKKYSANCYDQLARIYQICNHGNVIRKLFNITDNKEDKLIKLYRDNFNGFNNHSKMHLLARGNLIGMFSQRLLNRYLVKNSKLLNKIVYLFKNDIDVLLNKYVLIGYTADDRKKNIGELFKSVDDDYKKFLGIITILETTYVFKRLNSLKLIDLKIINDLINEYSPLLKKCIIEDKYNFKTKAATKYVNALYFIINQQDTIKSLKNILPNNTIQNIIEYYISLYDKKPETTTIYGITHILIEASEFYTKRISDIYKPLLDILYEAVSNSNIFNNITLDLQIEILLCCKLFGDEINIDMEDYIRMDELEKNEHTNMLYILLKKYNIK